MGSTLEYRLKPGSVFVTGDSAKFNDLNREKIPYYQNSEAHYVSLGEFLNTLSYNPHERAYFFDAKGKIFHSVILQDGMSTVIDVIHDIHLPGYQPSQTVSKIGFANDFGNDSSDITPEQYENYKSRSEYYGELNLIYLDNRFSECNLRSVAPLSYRHIFSISNGTYQFYPYPISLSVKPSDSRGDSQTIETNQGVVLDKFYGEKDSVGGDRISAEMEGVAASPKDFLYKPTYKVNVKFIGSSNTNTIVAVPITATATLHTEPIKVTSIDASGLSWKTYYDSGTKFEKPSGKIVVYFSDKKNASYNGDAPEITYYQTYYHDGDIEENDLLVKGVIISQDCSIWLRFSGTVNGIKCEYSSDAIKSIQVANDDVESISVSSDSYVVISSSLQQNAGKLHLGFNMRSGMKNKPITYSEATTETSYSWKFSSPTKRYMKGDVSSDGTVSVSIDVWTRGYSNTLEINVPAKKPTVGTVSFVAGESYKNNLINNADPIDFLGDKTEAGRSFVRFEYKDSDYVSNVPYSNAASGEDAPYFTARCEELVDSYKFDGSANVSVTVNEDTLSKDITINLSAHDEFGNIDNTLKIGATIYEIDEITGIKLVYAKPRYSIGEKFSANVGDLVVRIYFKNSSGKTQSAEIDASQGGIETLSIIPMPGTLLKETGAIEVVVKSIFSNQLSLSFQIYVSNEKTYSISTKNTNLVYYRLSDPWSYTTSKKTYNFETGTYILVSQDDVASYGTGVSLNGYLARSYLEDDKIIIRGYVKNVYVASEEKDGTEIWRRSDNEEDISYSPTQLNNGVLVLFDDYKPEIEGQSNIMVQFPCYDREASDFVNNCSFGIAFGHNNSLNRLFLSGNKSNPNYDIHSSEINVTNDRNGDKWEYGDFSYFPMEAQCKYGESENAIVGYDVVSDSKLLVLKNRSGKEKTIYFRTPTMATAIDSTGKVSKDLEGNALKQEEYTISMSNSSVSGMSPYCVCNFEGDTVFVDENKEIAGLDIQGIVGDSQRQANTRSHYIDKEVSSLDVDGATLFSFNGKLFLDVPKEKVCYVASKESYSNDSRQYDWWKIDGFDGTCFMEMGGVLYYGSADGSIMKVGNGYYDIKKKFVEDSLADVNFKSDIIINSDITDGMSDGKLYTWTTVGDKPESLLYRNVASVDAEKKDNSEAYVDGNEIVVESKKALLELGDEKSFFIKPWGLVENPYYEKEIKIRYTGKDDKSNRIALLYDGSDINLSPYANGFYIMEKVEKDAFAMKVGDGQIKLYSRLLGDVRQTEDASDYAIDLNQLGGQKDYVSIKGYLSELSPVKSMFITAPLLIESANWFKHIVKIDLTQGTSESNDIRFAYCTNKMPAEGKEMKVADTIGLPDSGAYFKFSEFSFSRLSFKSNAGIRTYTIGREVKQAKYVSVLFESTEAINSVLPMVSISYTRTGLSKGINE